MNDYNINATITADGSQFEQTLKNITGETKKFSLNMGSLGKALAKTFVKGGVIMTGIHLVTKALKGMADQLKQGIKLYEDSAQKQKLLAQTLKVTGANAWTSSEKLNAMASSLQKVTNYTSDEITDLQTVLLGFKNITEENFEAATEAILDMATVMGMDLKSACQTVGKALDDPIKGLGSLSRQGFQFSEAEKQMLEDMVNVGDIAKAQDVILKELNTTYGGAAKAGAKATTQLKNSWGDLLKEMGRGVVLNIDVGPAIQKLQKIIDDFKSIIQENNDINETAKKITEAQKAMKAGTATDEQKILYYEEEIRLIDIELKQQEGLLKYESEREEAEKEIARLEAERAKNSNQMSYIKKVQELQEKLNKQMAEYDQKKEDELTYEETIAKLKQDHLNAIEEQKKQWELTKQVTSQEVSLEEQLKFYQQDLIDIINEANGGISEQNDYYKSQMKIIEDLQNAIALMNAPVTEDKYSDEWAKKIREQTVERLEAEKTANMQSKEFAQKSAQEKYEIEKEYNDLILSLELERLEEEKEAALKSVEGFANAEEEKARVVEYFNNEAQNLMTKYSTEMEDAGEFAGMSFAEGFAIAVKYVKQVGEKIVKAVKSIISGIKSVIQKGVKIFQNLFRFDPDKTLDALLEWEDSVLTFFIETLPKLPGFFESALQSISVMLKTIDMSIDKEQIRKIINDIIDVFSIYLPDILETGKSIGDKIIYGIEEAIDDNIDKLKSIAQMIVEFIVGQIVAALPGTLTAILTGIVKVINPLINGILELLPKIIDAVLEFLEGIIGDVLPELIPTLINAITKIITSIMSKLPKIIRLVFKLVQAIIHELPKILTQLLPEILKAILEMVPELIVETVKGIADLIGSLTTHDLLAIIFAVGEAVIKIFGEVVSFIPNAISTLLSNIAGAIKGASWEDIKTSFKDGWEKIAESFTSAWTSAIDTVKKAFETLYNTIKDFVDLIISALTSIGNGIKNAYDWAKSGVTTAGGWIAGKASDAWSGIKGIFGNANGTNNAYKGLSLVGEAGPELVRFNGGEQVLNTRNTQKALADMGKGSSVFNVTFNNTQDTTAFAMMNQLKQYQRNLAFNSVM